MLAWQVFYKFTTNPVKTLDLQRTGKLEEIQKPTEYYLLKSSIIRLEIRDNLELSQKTWLYYIISSHSGILGETSKRITSEVSYQVFLNIGNITVLFE